MNKGTACGCTGLRAAGIRHAGALESVISNLRKIGFHSVHWQLLELEVLRASEDSDDAIMIMADGGCLSPEYVAQDLVLAEKGFMG